MSGRRDDMPGDVEEDLRKIRRVSQTGMDTSGPALVELAFGIVAALAGGGWLVALWWVPDVIPGQMWLASGALAGLVIGLPTLAIYWLRRGGAGVLARLVWEVTR